MARRSAPGDYRLFLAATVLLIPPLLNGVPEILRLLEYGDAPPAANISTAEISAREIDLGLPESEPDAEVAALSRQASDPVHSAGPGW